MAELGCDLACILARMREVDLITSKSETVDERVNEGEIGGDLEEKRERWRGEEFRD